MAQSDRSHEGRLSALEQGFESMRGEVHGLRTDMRTFTSEMRDGLNEIKRDSAQNSRTQWGPLIALGGVLLALLSAVMAGPLTDISRLMEWQHRTQQNRFTDHDGAMLRQYVDDKAKHEDELSNMRHEMQDRMLTLTQSQLDKIWELMRSVSDEDFKRPEAEAMRGELMEEIRALRIR